MAIAWFLFIVGATVAICAGLACVVAMGVNLFDPHVDAKATVARMAREKPLTFWLIKFSAMLGIELMALGFAFPFLAYLF